MASPMSHRIEEKEKFLSHYLSCGVEARFLFDYVRTHTVLRCKKAHHGYTDKPDFRLGHGVNFCTMKPNQNNVRIDVQLKNNMRPEAASLEFTETPHSGNGEAWLSFYVTNRGQLDDTVAVIGQIYENRLREAS